MTMPMPRVGSYVRPKTLADALQHLAARTSSVLAGGTDLVLLRADGVTDRTNDLLDVKGVPDLTGIRSHDNGKISIGACTSLQDVANMVALPPNAISDSAAVIGGWQTRARGTVGGNVCRASPAGDTLPGMLVTRAAFDLASSSGTRLVPADGFFVGPGQSVLQSNELLTHITLGYPRGASAYLRFTLRRAMDLAIVGVAAYVDVVDGRCIDARIALSAAAATPVLASDAAQALIGTRLDETAINRAAGLVLNPATPIDDARSSQMHRRIVLPVLAQRAIHIAHLRASTQRGSRHDD